MCVRRCGCVIGAICLIAAGSCVHEPTAPAIPAVTDQLFGKGNTLWFVADTLGGGTMRPAMADGVIYLLRHEFEGQPEVTAINAATGQLVWRQPRSIATNAVVVGDYLAMIWGAIFVYDRRQGTPLRTIVTDRVDYRGDLVTDGTRLYAGTYYGDVVAVNPATGKEEWHTSLAEGTSWRAMGLAVLGDRIAVTVQYDRPMGVTVDADSAMVAVLDRASGSVIWRRPMARKDDAGADFVNAPVISANVVVTVSITHTVHAYDVSSGTPLWSYDASRGDPYHASWGIAACDGSVFISDGDLGLVSLDAQSGAVNWQIPNLDQGSMHWIDCGYGTVMALASYLTLVDARTGDLVRRVDGSRYLSLFVESAARDQNTLYVSTDRGYGAIRLP